MHADYWGALLDRMSDQNHTNFLDFLMTFPLLSVTRRMALDVLQAANEPEFDAPLLLHTCPYSRVLSCLCDWTKLVLKIVVLLNKWTFCGKEYKPPQHAAVHGSARALSRALSGAAASVAALPELSHLSGQQKQLQLSNTSMGRSGIMDCCTEITPYTVPVIRPHDAKSAVAQVATNRSRLPAIGSINLPNSGYKKQAKLRPSPQIQANLPRRHGPLFHPAVPPIHGSAFASQTYSFNQSSSSSWFISPKSGRSIHSSQQLTISPQSLLQTTTIPPLRPSSAVRNEAASLQTAAAAAQQGNNTPSPPVIPMVNGNPRHHHHRRSSSPPTTKRTLFEAAGDVDDVQIRKINEEMQATIEERDELRTRLAQLQDAECSEHTLHQTAN
jgi:hypothetical protein